MTYQIFALVEWFWSHRHITDLNCSKKQLRAWWESLCFATLVFHMQTSKQESPPAGVEWTYERWCMWCRWYYNNSGSGQLFQILSYWLFAYQNLPNFAYSMTLLLMQMRWTMMTNTAVGHSQYPQALQWWAATCVFVDHCDILDNLGCQEGLHSYLQIWQVVCT
jgi:hypothetical protein